MGQAPVDALRLLDLRLLRHRLRVDAEDRAARRLPRALHLRRPVPHGRPVPHARGDALPHRHGDRRAPYRRGAADRGRLQAPPHRPARPAAPRRGAPPHAAQLARSVGRPLPVDDLPRQGRQHRPVLAHGPPPRREAPRLAGDEPTLARRARLRRPGQRRRCAPVSRLGGGARGGQGPRVRRADRQGHRQPRLQQPARQARAQPRLPQRLARVAQHAEPARPARRAASPPRQRAAAHHRRALRLPTGAARPRAPAPGPPPGVHRLRDRRQRRDQLEQLAQVDRRRGGF
mmetsp:Transcript_31886/g.105266  ORF Transcript_31886/g.105266 Transcript_31886/m.105266 type:complete len:288 (-) Transcript_31886:130-993(-)